MMKLHIVLFNILLVLILLYVLTGCATRPEKVYVTKYKTMIITPPKKLYKDDIKLPQPPDRYLYIQADPVHRERMLTTYVIKLLYTIKKYRIKLNTLDKWYLNMHTKE